MRKELKEAKEVAKAEHERLSSWKTYSIKGENLKSLYENMFETIDYVSELEEEIEKLKNQKPVTKNVYRGRG